MRFGSSLAVCVVAAACAGHALGSVIATEPFDYPAGGLVGQNGGSGFSGAWTGNAGVGVFNPGLTYPGYNAVGNAAFTPGSGNGAFRQLSSTQGAVDGGVTYVAFLTQAPDASEPEYAGLSLFQGATEKLFIGKRFQQTTYGIERSGTSSFANSSAASSTGTHLLIAKIVFGSGDTPGNERIFFYVDPPLSTGPIGPTFVLPDVPSFSFDTIRVQSGNVGESYNFDDVRIGTSLADVVAITPEPATAGLVAVGALAVLARRARRVRAAR